ncbi:MAG: phage tail protein [Lachnospiraceae bacterium]
MKQKKAYFILNKESDFSRGRGEGIRFDAESISLMTGKTEGVYRSRVFDSRERQTVWHRLTMEGLFFGEASVEVFVYASDSLDQEEEACLQAVFRKPEDVLLHQVKGRYLWLKVIFTGQKGREPKIDRIQIYFPKDTWIGYLPEVYQNDRESADFLERYLAIFQSVYEDMTRRIEDVPALFDPGTGPREPLMWMAQWLSVENINLWNEEQLRYLIKNGVRLYQYRGTVGYLKEILKLYTGSEPLIVERHQLEPFFDGGKGEEELKSLYSSYPYEFTILLNVSQVDANNRDVILKQLVDMAKPANMECRIVPLKPYIFLGQYSYLGINSVLGQYKEFQLDGLCAVPFSTVAGQ